MLLKCFFSEEIEIWILIIVITLIIWIILDKLIKKVDMLRGVCEHMKTWKKWYNKAMIFWIIRSNDWILAHVPCSYKNKNYFRCLQYWYINALYGRYPLKCWCIYTYPQIICVMLEKFYTCTYPQKCGLCTFILETNTCVIFVTACVVVSSARWDLIIRWEHESVYQFKYRNRGE